MLNERIENRMKYFVEGQPLTPSGRRSEATPWNTILPLWKETVQAIKMYLESRSVRFDEAVPLFVTTRGNRLTRFGLRYIIANRVAEAAKICPSLFQRKITPHTWRHTNKQRSTGLLPQLLNLIDENAVPS